MTKDQVLAKLEKAWSGLMDSIAGLTEAQLVEPGVMGDWSVRDILAHVTTWEEETLEHLPVILRGGRTERYSVKYGGIDAFNAIRTEQKRNLPPAEVLDQLEETHRRLVEFVRGMPEEQFTRETRARRRIRLDTYAHYPEHSTAILAWRERGP